MRSSCFADFSSLGTVQDIWQLLPMALLTCILRFECDGCFAAEQLESCEDVSWLIQPTVRCTRATHCYSTG
jgi:hypothetical protein